MEVVAWHWLDDQTMMVLGADMVWYRLEGVYPANISFPELDMDSSESCEITVTQRYQSADYRSAPTQPASHSA